MMECNCAEVWKRPWRWEPQNRPQKHGAEFCIARLHPLRLLRISGQRVAYQASL